jgi:hypothetical protein
MIMTCNRVLSTDLLGLENLEKAQLGDSLKAVGSHVVERKRYQKGKDGEGDRLQDQVLVLIY